MLAFWILTTFGIFLMTRFPPPAETAELWAFPAKAWSFARPPTEELILVGLILMSLP